MSSFFYFFKNISIKIFVLLFFINFSRCKCVSLKIKFYFKQKSRLILKKCIFRGVILFFDLFQNLEHFGVIRVQFKHLFVAHDGFFLICHPEIKISELPVSSH